MWCAIFGLNRTGIVRAMQRVVVSRFLKQWARKINSEQLPPQSNMYSTFFHTKSIPFIANKHVFLGTLSSLL